MVRRDDPADSAELRRLRRRVDILDRRIVALLNERAELALDIGRAKAAAGRRAIRDLDREREVLIRVAVTGSTAAPPLFETMAVLGRERSLERLRSALRRLGR